LPAAGVVLQLKGEKFQSELLRFILMSRQPVNCSERGQEPVKALSKVKMPSSPIQFL
jgi:hypothetical protein